MQNCFRRRAGCWFKKAELLRTVKQSQRNFGWEQYENTNAQ
jgi:hypothetical protein